MSTKKEIDRLNKLTPKQWAKEPKQDNSKMLASMIAALEPKHKYQQPEKN